MRISVPSAPPRFGQSYDGTTLPLAAGYLLIGLAVLGIAYVFEHDWLF